MKLRFVTGCLLLVLGGPALAEHGYGPLIRNGLDEQLAIGADLFFSETFEGNGRTCATCHAVADNYTLPANLASVSQFSPLMVGDPDNPAHVPELELCDPDDSSENCQAIRQNGLILVNPDGNNPGPDGFRSYSMRSIPHVLSLPTSLAAPPGALVDQTGWSGDGAPGSGSLREFATGAVRQHFTRHTDRVPGLDFREPDEDELDAMAAFQLELGRRSDIGLAGVTFLDANATSGRATFNDRCASCHANAGALNGGDNDNFNTHIEESRMSGCPSPGNPGKCAEDSALLVPGANHDGGFGLDDLNAVDDRWGDGTFNTPPLIEAADTAPFFHDNRSTTLEQAIGFYRTPDFLDSPACDGVDPCGLAGTLLPGPETQIGAMLRILNAGLNVAMASQRIYAAYGLLSTEPGTDPSVIKTLSLAREEVADARASIGRARIGQFPVFDNTDNHILDARTALDQVLASLDASIADGAGGLQLVIILANLIGLTENHLSADFYDESPDRCANRGVTVSQGQYHDCRWLYDLGRANVLFDDAGVTPSIVPGQTELTWTPNPGGTATLTLKWRTAEWSNPLFDETVLTDLSPHPSFPPITFTGSVTQLPDGQFERTYSHTIPCEPNRKYKMTVQARVGGVTETDSDVAKSSRFCIAF
jgi:mono/diheme cytochrome c family protein